MRYSKYRSDGGIKPPKQVSPVWRGIGCILFFLTPIISIAIASELLAIGVIQRWIYVPPNLLRSYTIPVLNFTIPNFLGSLGLGIGVTIMLFAFFAAVYAAMYRVIGPSPYGPTDVPPIKTKRKVKKSR